VAEQPSIAGFIVAGLRAAGHVIDVAVDGQEALELGRARTYDVLVMAFGLRDSAGVDVVSAMRDAGQTAPILLLTPGDISAEFPVGAAEAVLAKPFRFEALLERLNALDER